MLATMNGLADLFLRAKHWRLFLLLFVFPTLVELAATGYMPITLRSWRDLGPGGFIYLGLAVGDGFIWSNRVRKITCRCRSCPRLRYSSEGGYARPGIMFRHSETCRALSCGFLTSLRLYVYR